VGLRPLLAEIVGSNPAGKGGLHSEDSVFGMVTGLQARRSWVRIPSVARYFVSSPGGPDGCGVHPGLCSMGTGVLSPGKAAGEDNVDNSSPSPPCRYGAVRENVTFSTPYRSEYALFFSDTGPKIQTAVAARLYTLLDAVEHIHYVHFLFPACLC